MLLELKNKVVFPKGNPACLIQSNPSSAHRDLLRVVLPTQQKLQAEEAKASKLILCLADVLCQKLVSKGETCLASKCLSGI